MGLDNQNQRKEIFGKVNSILTTLEFDSQVRRERQNLDSWKQAFRDFGDLTDNPIPFLLGLIKTLKSRSQKNPKSEPSEEKGFRSSRKRRRRSEDDNQPGAVNRWVTEKKTKTDAWLKNNVDDEYGRIIKDVLRRAIRNTIPKLKNILIEEILRAFNCDLESEVPVVGDGLTTDIVIRIDQFDFFKQLMVEPNVGVGKYYYESEGSIDTPGGIPFSMNRYLYFILQNPGQQYPIYGASNLILFTVEYDELTQSLIISPHYKSPNSNIYTVNDPSFVGNGTKFTFAELLQDYFDKIDVFELHNLLGALLEILSGLSISSRNEGINLADVLGINKLIKTMNKIVESCNGIDLGVVSTETISHLAELFDDDSFYSFSVQEDRILYEESIKRQKGVIKFESCDNIEIPLDNGIFEEGADEIISSLIEGGDGYKAFDLILQYGVEGSVANSPNPAFKELNWNFNINFVEGVILNLPQIMMLALMSSKVILPVTIIAKLLNEDALLASNAQEFAKIFKRFFVRVLRELLSEITKELFNVMKQYLMVILTELAKVFLKTKLGKQTALILSLISLLLPFIEELQDAKDCKEIFDIVLRLIDAVGLDVPFPPPPQFLLFAAAGRSGNNSVRTFQSMIGKLESLGIPTGDMPDGSPNLWLLSMYAQIQAIDEENTKNGVTHITTFPSVAAGPPGATVVPPIKGIGVNV